MFQATEPRRERNTADVLGDVLLNTRLLASGGGILDIAAPWGYHLKNMNIALGAILLDGPCWFEAEDCSLRKLQPGDSILTRPGQDYRLMSSCDAEIIASGELMNGQNLAKLDVGHRQNMQPVARIGTGGLRTRILTFGLIAEDTSSSSIFHHLPPVLFFGTGSEKRAQWVAAAVAFFTSESMSAPGYTSTATRLVELLFTEFVREHVLAAPASAAGWLSGMIDPSIGRAITCIHSRPGEHWTVPRLAREAGLGRSTFARRFSELLGMSPIDYLIDHRMNLACARLTVDRRPVGIVASELGYRSERAFRQGFRKRFGVAPSQYLKSRSGEHAAALNQ